MAMEFKALSRPHFAEISNKHKEYSHLLESELDAALEEGALRTDISTKLIRLSLLNILNWTPRWFRPNGTLSASELTSIYERVFWEGVANSEGSFKCSLRPSFSRQSSGNADVTPSLGHWSG